MTGFGEPGVHEPGDLAAHALGLLAPPEADRVQAHLSGCATCWHEWTELRQTSAMLGEVPPEMFLDGPPSADGSGDLPLQRALWRVRGEARAERGRRRLVLAAAAVVTGVALIGGAAAVGRATAPEVTAAPVDPGAGTGQPSRTVQGSDGPVSLSAVLTPAEGWTRVAVSATGIPPGERCRIVLRTADGTEHVTGGWVTGQNPGGAPIQGSALVDEQQVTAVVVRNEAGRTFITVPT